MRERDSERERENEVINGEVVTVLNRIKYNAMKTYGKAYVQLHAFCTSALDEDKWSAAPLRRFASPGAIGPKIDWAPKAVWRCDYEKNVYPCREWREHIIEADRPQ